MTKYNSDDILIAIASIAEKQGYPPTYRQIGEELGLAPSAVFYRVGQLRKEGLLEEADSGSARTIRLSRDGRSHARSIGTAIGRKGSP